MTFDLLQIANIDEVFDALIALPDAHVDKADERIPYWTEIWPSALALSVFILNNKDRVKGKTVLELGAGMGLPSLVAASYTSAVVCSDYLTDALIFAKRMQSSMAFCRSGMNVLIGDPITQISDTSLSLLQT